MEAQEKKEEEPIRPSDSQRAHRQSKKRSNKGKSPTNKMSRNFCQDNAQAYEEIRRNNVSPKAHAFHAMEDKHEYKRHTVEWDMLGMTEMMWKQKKTNT